MLEHGLALADLSMGGNTDDMVNPSFFNEPAGFVSRATRVRREVGIPVATSWSLGVPQTADTVIRQQLIDVAMIGRPALSNPRWPAWAARELGHETPFDLVPADWRWWLQNFRGHAPSIGLPPTAAAPPPLRPTSRSRSSARSRSARDPCGRPTAQRRPPTRRCRAHREPIGPRATTAMDQISRLAHGRLHHYDGRPDHGVSNRRATDFQPSPPRDKTSNSSRATARGRVGMPETVSGGRAARGLA